MMVMLPLPATTATAPTATTTTTATVATLKAPARPARASTPLHRLSLSERRHRLLPAPIVLLVLRGHAQPLTPAQRLDQQHAPRRWERVALWLLLAAHCGLWGHGSAFWDTDTISFAPKRLRPALRRRAARERAQVSGTLRRIQRETQRVYGCALAQQTEGVALLWHVQIAALLDTHLAATKTRLSIETDGYGATHYRFRPVGSVGSGPTGQAKAEEAEENEASC